MGVFLPITLQSALFNEKALCVLLRVHFSGFERAHVHVPTAVIRHYFPLAIYPSMELQSQPKRPATKCSVSQAALEVEGLKMCPVALQMKA
ncbi:hypothetical protein FKM82_007111 [Ascaphus truei]